MAIPKQLIEYGYLDPFNLSLERKTIAATIAAFSFTSLAALTAVSSIFLVFIEKPVFREYKEEGNLIIFMSLYALCAALLVSNCFLALVNHAPQISTYTFMSMLYVFSITIGQMVLIFFIILALIYRSITSD